MIADKLESWSWWSTKLATALLCLLVPLCIFAALIAMNPVARGPDSAVGDPQILGTYGWIVVPVLFYVATLWGFIWHQWRKRYLRFRTRKNEIANSGPNDESALPWRLVDYGSWITPPIVVALIFIQGEFFWFPMALFWLLLCFIGVFASRYGLAGYIAIVALLQFPVVFFTVAIGFSPATGFEAIKYLAAMTFSVGIFAGGLYFVFDGFDREIPPHSEATRPPDSY